MLLIALAVLASNRLEARMSQDGRLEGADHRRRANDPRSWNRGVGGAAEAPDVTATVQAWGRRSEDREAPSPRRRKRDSATDSNLRLLRIRLAEEAIRRGSS